MKIGALPLEHGVLLLLQHKDDIARVRIRVLIGHVPECHLVPIRGALLHEDLKDLTLLLCLEALAIAPASTALRLHLLDHRAHPDHLDLHTSSASGVACQCRGVTSAKYVRADCAHRVDVERMPRVLRKPGVCVCVCVCSNACAPRACPETMPKVDPGPRPKRELRMTPAV